MPDDAWRTTQLGAGGPRVSRLALASSYGAGAREVEGAFERGIGVFFWGALRKRRFGDGLRRLAKRRRDAMVIAVQTFARQPWLIRPSVEAARLRLGIDALDVLCLAYREAIDVRITDAARALVDRGLVRSLMLSSHDQQLLASSWSDFDALMVRYNAAHRSAEHTVLPVAQTRARPVVAYTATRWGSLIGDAVRASDCYRFVLSHPAVTACLFGPADEREMLEALATFERGPMTANELAWMKRVGDQVHTRYLRAPPLGASDYVRHARGMAKSILQHGFTEDLLSRFNR